MEIKAFLIRFEKNLISNGFSQDTARHHTLKVAKSLTDADKQRILSMKEETQTDAVAGSYVARLKKRMSVPVEKDDSMANTSTISNTFRGSMPDKSEEQDEPVKVYNNKKNNNDSAQTENSTASTLGRSEESSFEDNGETRQFTHVGTNKNEDNGETRQFSHVGIKDGSDESRHSDSDNVKTTKIDVIKKDGERNNKKSNSADNNRTKTISRVNSGKAKLSAEGKKEYAKKLLVRSPLFVLGFAGAGAGALIVYTLIAILIAVFIGVLVGVVAIGGIGTLAGLIYGIIKIFSVTPEGLYEIGFALSIAGATMALAICSYNIAVRAIPVLWRLFTEFLASCIAKFKTYIRKIRKECADK